MSIIVMTGLPGSGKDTQANLLAERFGFKVVSTGQLLREELKSDSELARMIRPTYEAGNWVPDDLVYKVLSKWLEAHRGQDAILTGAVRTPEQVEMLDNSLDAIGEKLGQVINLKISEETSLKRISGRLEDPVSGKSYHAIYNPPPEGLNLVKRDLDEDMEATMMRIQETKTNQDKIFEKYGRRGILIEIDGESEVEEIHKELVSKLNLKI